MGEYNSMTIQSTTVGKYPLEEMEQHIGHLGGFIFECHTFLPFHTVHGVLKARTLKWFATSFPGGSDGEETVYNAGDLSLIPGQGRSPEEGNDYPLQYIFLENPMDRRAYWAAVHGVAKNQT